MIRGQTADTGYLIASRLEEVKLGDQYPLLRSRVPNTGHPVQCLIGLATPKDVVCRGRAKRGEDIGT